LSLGDVKGEFDDLTHSGLERGLTDKSYHCLKACVRFSIVPPVGAAVRSDSLVYIPRVNTPQQ
jgi:hypothetical protein